MSLQNPSLRPRAAGRGTPVGESGAARVRCEWAPQRGRQELPCPRRSPTVPEPGSLLGHRPPDDIGSAVGGIEQGFGRQVRIALSH